MPKLGPVSGWVVSVTSRRLYPRERALVCIVQEDGWAAGPVWTDTEKRRSLAVTGVRIPDHPVCSDYAIPAPFVGLCVKWAIPLQRQVAIRHPNLVGPDMQAMEGWDYLGLLIGAIELAAWLKFCFSCLLTVENVKAVSSIVLLRSR